VEVDLPGGKRHVYETAWACALREAAEELYTDEGNLVALRVQPQFMVTCGRGGVMHFLRGTDVASVIRLEAEALRLGDISQWRSKIHLVASVGPLPEGVGAASGGGGEGAAGLGHDSEAVDADVASLGAMLGSMGL
jgi:hypothetical protein